MRAAAIVIGVGWVVFWVYWLVSAMSAKSASRPGLGGGVGAVFVVVFYLLRLRAFRAWTLGNAPWLLALGLLLFFGGLGLAVWARVYLGRNWGTPMSQKDNPELVTAGPYRKVRHPIYTGIITAMTGTALATSLLWLATAVIVGGYFIVSATREERYMTGLFPDAYPDYKQSTKMLIPYIL
jgi:isoprenylcysteine carboxyl methyltransferase (ICMT) family protein YpbQ